MCVLAAIKDGDSYGYQIIKDLKPDIVLSESTLYTILKRLELAGMLTVYTLEHGGRLRKYYHITKAHSTQVFGPTRPQIKATNLQHSFKPSASVPANQVVWLLRVC